MPTAGLSLVGFMDQAVALAYLKGPCVPVDDSDAALTAEWNAARIKLGLGVAIPSAGNPSIQPIQQNDPHIQALLQQQWAINSVLPLLAQGASFQLVEIDPLLAFQFHIYKNRSTHHCGGLPPNPSVQQLMDICLPITPPAEPIRVSLGQQSVIVHSPSLNVLPLQRGLINGAFMGVQFGPSLPMQHVVRYNGRCYLHNGFHRAMGARAAGATHVPCLFRDVGTAEEAGIGSGTFQTQLLESANPPTLGHFTGGRAYDVSLRALQRVMHVSWTDFVIPVE